MPHLEINDSFETDSSGNEEEYSKLLFSVSQLDSTQRVKPATRKEASSEVSEYNLTKNTDQGRNLVNVKDLAEVLGKRPAHSSVTKKLKKVVSKSKTLAKPLEKPVEEKIKRSVGFENIKKQLNRWEAIVTRNSVKDHLSFPLNNKSIKIQGTNEFLRQFQNSSPLKEEMDKILKKNNTKLEEEDKDTFPLTLEEMMEKRKEMAQLRAKMSYKEAKAQRQSKIKSKKYHRILKRQKLREQLKEFEILKKSDQEAALKKLSELDKSRAQERASLRHRNTGQWAKNLTVRAKYDVESRKVLAEQLKMSREITQKIHALSSSDDDEDYVIEGDANNSSKMLALSTSDDNPWSLNISSDMKNFVSDYRKYWSEKNKSLAETQKNEINISETNGETKHSNLNSNVTDIIENNTVLMVNSQSSNSTPDLKKNNSKKIKTKNNKIKKIAASNLSNVSLENNTIMKHDSNYCNYRNNNFGMKFYPTSGTWIVSPTTDELVKNTETELNSIDDLFDDLSDKLIKKGELKINKIKKHEKRRKSKIKKFSIEKNNSNSNFDLSIKNNNVIERPDVDMELSEGVDDEKALGFCLSNTPLVAQKNNEITPAIDPTNFIQVKPKLLSTQLPENLTTGEDTLDNEKTQKMTIESAFVDDDIFAEFQEQKEKENKSSEVNIPLSLPGWGEWGGDGINLKSSKRKKRRLIINLPPRKDKKKPDLIINENENLKLKSHLVKEVPHPFKSVEAFEANIRAPVGRDWVPETAHRTLIQKHIETKLGTIIEPMDEDEIVKLKQKPKSPYQGKSKIKAK